mmetsp:Transcript_2368/g.6263  ORF Transcript_2368/g.6263 Transcript_2368/m.6263 type:complete len:582 (+) Transcript_2368:1958-3703(+)
MMTMTEDGIEASMIQGQQQEGGLWQAILPIVSGDKNTLLDDHSEWIRSRLIQEQNQEQDERQQSYQLQPRQRQQWQQVPSPPTPLFPAPAPLVSAAAAMSGNATAVSPAHAATILAMLNRHMNMQQQGWVPPQQLIQQQPPPAMAPTLMIPLAGIASQLSSLPPQHHPILPQQTLLSQLAQGSSLYAAGGPASASAAIGNAIPSPPVANPGVASLSSFTQQMHLQQAGMNNFASLLGAGGVSGRSGGGGNQYYSRTVGEATAGSTLAAAPSSAASFALDASASGGGSVASSIPSVVQSGGPAGAAAQSQSQSQSQPSLQTILPMPSSSSGAAMATATISQLQQQRGSGRAAGDTAGLATIPSSAPSSSAGPSGGGRGGRLLPKPVAQASATSSGTAAVAARSDSIALPANPKVAEHAAAITTASNEEDRPRTLPSIISLNSDTHVLSPYQCLLREQIEAFEATQEDVRYNDSRMNRQIVLGQVGLRCRHCANQAQWCRAPSAAYYPTRMDAIYQVGQNLAKNHILEGCASIPPDIRKKLLKLRSERARASGGKDYWRQASIYIGLTQQPNVEGVRFKSLRL